MLVYVYTVTTVQLATNKPQTLVNIATYNNLCTGVIITMHMKPK